jgi:hypothetical protein
MGVRTKKVALRTALVGAAIGGFVVTAVPGVAGAAPTVTVLRQGRTHGNFYLLELAGRGFEQSAQVQVLECDTAIATQSGCSAWGGARITVDTTTTGRITRFGIRVAKNYPSEGAGTVNCNTASPCAVEFFYVSSGTEVASLPLTFG